MLTVKKKRPLLFIPDIMIFWNTSAFGKSGGGRVGVNRPQTDLINDTSN